METITHQAEIINSTKMSTHIIHAKASNEFWGKLVSHKKMKEILFNKKEGFTARKFPEMNMMIIETSDDKFICQIDLSK